VNRNRVVAVGQAETREATMIRIAALIFAALHHLSHRPPAVGA